MLTKACSKEMRIATNGFLSLPWVRITIEPIGSKFMLHFHEDFSQFYSDASLSKNQMILYGAGNRGCYLGRAFDHMGYEYSYYWDIDPNLHGMMLNCKPIIHPSSINIQSLVAKDIPCYIFMTLGAKELILSALCWIESLGLQANVYIPSETNINNIFSDARRKKLITHDFSLISNTCLAGVLYKALACKMLSPTVNMIIEPKDYVKLCSGFEKYMEHDLVYSHSEWRPSTKEHYPVAKLDDVYIHMVHYKTFDEVKDDWDRRKGRIVWNNLFFIFHDWHFQLQKDDIENFLEIKYSNKLCLLSKSFYDFKNSNSIVFSKNDSLLLETQPRLIEDHFDFVKWINNAIRY